MSWLLDQLALGAAGLAMVLLCLASVGLLSWLAGWIVGRW